jgi:general secretion pathway protein M
MNRLPPIVGRLAALLILLGGIGLVYLALVQPLLDDYLDTRDAIVDASSALARYRGVAADLPQRQKELAQLRQRQATSEGFLQGPNDALVAAQIQNRIKALVEAAHGELKSTQVLPPQDEGKYRRLAIRAQMTLDIGAAQRVLYGVETASPLLFLDNVDLRAHMIDRRRERGANPPNDNELDVRIDVFGYVRAAKSSSDGQPTTGGSPSTASR